MRGAGDENHGAFANLTFDCELRSKGRVGCLEDLPEVTVAKGIRRVEVARHVLQKSVRQFDRFR